MFFLQTCLEQDRNPLKAVKHDKKALKRRTAIPTVPFKGPSFGLLREFLSFFKAFLRETDREKGPWDQLLIFGYFQ